MDDHVISPSALAAAMASLDVHALEARGLQGAHDFAEPAGPIARGSRGGRARKSHSRRARDVARRVVHFIEVKLDCLRKARERVYPWSRPRPPQSPQALGHLDGFLPGADCGSQVRDPAIRPP